MKKRKIFTIFCLSFFLVGCDKIFYFNKNKIVKAFKDHFGWKTDDLVWGEETDIKKWNQVIFNQNFSKDFKEFVDTGSYESNFLDITKQWNSILYLPKNFSFDDQRSKVPDTEEKLAQFKYDLDFENPEFKLCYFLTNIDDFNSSNLNNDILNDDNSSIWKNLFLNLKTNDSEFLVNLIVEDLTDNTFYLVNYSISNDYSNVTFKNIYFLDQTKINNLLKNLYFENIKEKISFLNTNVLNNYYPESEIADIRSQLTDENGHFLAFFNFNNNVQANFKNVNKNYNLNFSKEYENECNRSGSSYVCSVSDFLQTDPWYSDSSFSSVTLYFVNENKRIVLKATLDIAYYDAKDKKHFGSPNFFSLEKNNFFYSK